MSKTLIPPRATVLTYDDYRRLPDDGRRTELVEGVFEVVPGSEPGHQDVSRNLGLILALHVRRHGLGKVYYAPLDVVLDFTTVVQPDLLFLSNERLHLVTDQNVAGAPDLVVEILSPGTADRDRTKKAFVYAKHGVPYYWIVDRTPRLLEAYRLEQGRYELETRITGNGEFKPALFPGLVIPLVEVWE